MKLSVLKKIMNQRVNPKLQHLTLLPRSAQKTATIRCPQCGSVESKFVNTQVGCWCAHCGYQGPMGKIAAVFGTDQLRFAHLKCPKCGHEVTRDLETRSICLCDACGFKGQLTVQGKAESECKLDDAELASDQAVLNDVLTRKKP